MAPPFFGAVQRRYNVPNGPAGILYDGTSVWTGNYPLVAGSLEVQSSNRLSLTVITAHAQTGAPSKEKRPRELGSRATARKSTIDK